MQLRSKTIDGRDSERKRGRFFAEMTGESERESRPIGDDVDDGRGDGATPFEAIGIPGGRARVWTRRSARELFFRASRRASRARGRPRSTARASKAAWPAEGSFELVPGTRAPGTRAPVAPGGTPSARTQPATSHVDRSARPVRPRPACVRNMVPRYDEERFRWASRTHARFTLCAPPAAASAACPFRDRAPLVP